METKINIAEILKDCPKGMELYSTIFGTVYFEGVKDTGNAVLIDVKTVCNTEYQFYPDGKFNTYYSDSEMTLFPSKDVRTWKGFVPPCKFKTGDVLVSRAGNIVLFSHIDSENIVHYHCIIPTYGSFRIEENTKIGVGRYYECVLANEQQKQRMYDKIKCSGHKYNQITNKLEKLIEPKFKVGDKIANDDYVVGITEIDIEEEVYVYESKVGGIGCILFSEQDDWELVPRKFDINTLKPFEKVLMRSSNAREWVATFYSHYSNNKFYGCGMCCDQCIPFEGNEHLLGTDNDCDEYYKNWK